MSPTTGYLLRLAAWSLVLAAALGPVAWLWWRMRAARVADAAHRHRMAIRCIALLAVLPVLAGVALHAAFAGRGPVVTRLPAGSPSMPPVEALAAAPMAWAVLLLYVAGAVFALSRLLRALPHRRPPHELPAPDALYREVDALARTVGVGRAIEVRVAAVASPRIEGACRPRLLLPRGFAMLPRAERQALLLHELAHVARDDYPRNLALRLLMVPLWFLPAWPVHRALADAREELCDRWAVARGACPVALARGLVRLGEAGGNGARDGMAMAATSHLGQRVRLLLAVPAAGQRPDGAALPSRGAALVAGVALVLLVPAAALLVGRQDRVLDDLYHASAFAPVVAIRAQDPAGRFVLAVHRGRVIEASLDGLPLARADIEQQGESVRLEGGAGPPLDLRVARYGRIQWQARAPRQAPIDRSTI